MKKLLTILLTGGFIVLQQGTYVPNQGTFTVHQPMEPIAPAKSHSQVYREELESAGRQANQFAEGMESWRRAEGNQ